MRTLVCIDWGGTSIRAVRIAQGRIYSPSSFAAANIRTISAENLHDIANRLSTTLNVTSETTDWLIGAAGAADRVAAEKITKMMLSISGSDSTCKIFPDFLCNHAAAFGGKNGILSVNGTGSLLYAKNDDEERQLGGWGYLLDESPSGAFFGKLTLQSVLSFLEGDEEAQKIAEEYSVQYGKPDRHRILNDLYRSDNQQHYLGNFSKILTKAFDSGDKRARELIEKSIFVLINQLKYLISHSKENFPLVLSGIGGLWENWAIFSKLIRQALNKAKLPVVLKRPLYHPVFGPLLLQSKKQQQETSFAKILQTISEEEMRYERFKK